MIAVPIVDQAIPFLVMGLIELQATVRSALAVVCGRPNRPVIHVTECQFSGEIELG